MPRLKTTVRFPAKGLALVMENERAVIAAATRGILHSVRRRGSQGQSADGRRMPASKDGNAPLHRTGGLLASIVGRIGKQRVRKRRGATAPAASQGWEGSVFADGKRRYDEATTARRKASARNRTRLLRGAASVGAAVSGRKAGRIKRLRQALTNRDVAAILSLPPRDARSKAGARSVYRLFEVSTREYDYAVNVFRRRAKVSLRNLGRMRELRGSR